MKMRKGNLLKIFKSNLKQTKRPGIIQSLASSYKKISTHWVLSAKQDATKIKRLNELITDSEKETNKWKDNKYKKKYE